MSDDTLLMISLPNCGSTWLADLIAAHTPYSRYFQEYFNPIRQPAHYELLRTQFGCELVDCYRQIAYPGDKFTAEIVRKTWGRSGFNFTKEVFCAFKLERLAPHFSQTFVLLRDEADSFPPRRARAWGFYEHCYYAIAERQAVTPAATFEGRARIAYRIMRERLERDAGRLGVQVVQYRDLFDDVAGPPALARAIGADVGRLWPALRDSRRLVPR